MTLDLADLQQRLRAFAAARQWQPYHTPKNLAMALAGAGRMAEARAERARAVAWFGRRGMDAAEARFLAELTELLK